MDRAHVIASPNVSSLISGANFWGRKLSTKSFYYASSRGSKASQHKIKTQIQYNPLRFQQSHFNHHFKSIERGRTYEENNTKYVVKAVTVPSSESESQPSISKSVVDSIKNFFIILYQFIYPYATYGRLSAATSGCLIAVQKLSDISPLFFVGLLQALLPHLFMDLYVNGVNQVFDFEIDKINKPYLPLASGKLSFRNCAFIVVSAAILGIGLNLMIGSPALLANILLTFTLWTCYSVNVPFLRWKRYPVVAALFMFVSWTFIFPITYFLHMQVFWTSVFLYEMAFGVAFLAGATSSSPLWIKTPTTKHVDVTNSASTRSFYQFNWKGTNDVLLASSRAGRSCSCLIMLMEQSEGIRKGKMILLQMLNNFKIKKMIKGNWQNISGDRVTDFEALLSGICNKWWDNSAQQRLDTTNEPKYLTRVLEAF
ncbi:hypothetical protein VNO80_14694 [Phaseolus coccineus]|uniref:Uncharacterized protein n=1 Tax=Phaseolus coccineus TaxID=3886 RepID=A0AAN9MNK2_PHACN